MIGPQLSRRRLFKVSAIAGGGLMLQVTLPGSALAEEPEALVRSRELNVYVQIDRDGEITIYSSTPEMGQSIKTTLPMIIAEEMGARWEDVRVIDAPEDSERFGQQFTGGSTAVYRNIGTMRQMGASAREMLIGAAALLMEVDRNGLAARDSKVVHTSGESRSFGELAALAAEQPVPDPDTLTYKDPRSYTIIGTSVSGVDNLVIASGRSEFGIDVDIPDMKFAVYHRCPRIGGRAVRFNVAEILKLPGITHAFVLEPRDNVADDDAFGLLKAARLRGGVAIVGDDTWSVMEARKRLKVEWDDSGASSDDWSLMVERARETAAKESGEIRRDDGGVDKALGDSDNQRIDGFYQFSYAAHVCMEPMNCTADFRAGRNGEPNTLEVWTGAQMPAFVKQIAKHLVDVEPQHVTVHPLRMGGGFGRRAILDYATEAIAISREAGVPVKLTWSRTDDIHNDHFRVGGFEQMAGAVDSAGKIAAWDQHYIGFQHQGKAVTGSGLRGNEMSMTVIPNARVRRNMTEIDTPCGPWRAPSSNTNAFVEQSFLHELSTLAGRDHVEFLIDVMGERRWLEEDNVRAMHTGRAIDVIQLAAEKSGWGRTLPTGSGLGFAFYFCHAAHVAEVAQVSVDDQKRYHVDRVTVAVDVGPIINMSGALNQVEGSIVDGLSTMAMQQITMTNGVIEQHNFNDYPVMRIGATPEIDVHFIQSDFRSTGLGEPALPPLAPAVGNAIFAATGERIRVMPFTEAGYTLI